MAATDKRSRRTRTALREALADEIHDTGDLSRVTVTGVTRRADVTRRTFYSHYRDIPDLVTSLEDETIAELASLARSISQVTLPELEEAIQAFDPCPGAQDVLAYFRSNGRLLSALLGDGGDPAFVEKIKRMVREVVEVRAKHGFSPLLEAGFDYYLTFVISAEVGVLVRWLTTGMTESDDTMARIMTALLFIRPGDLYGRPINFEFPMFGSAVLAEGEETSNG